MPPSAIVSILHRVTGFGIFLMLPFLLYLLQESLRSEISYYHFGGIDLGRTFSPRSSCSGRC